MPTIEKEEPREARRAKILTKPLPQILDEMDAAISEATEAARRVKPPPVARVRRR
jgi:hypothetical protein